MMRSASNLVLLLLAVAARSSVALRAGPSRLHLARPAAPVLSRTPARFGPARALQFSDAAATPLPPPPESSNEVELCDSEDPEAVCTLPMGVTVPMSWVQTLKIGLCFATWFSLNVMYNLTNKRCQNVFPMPWTMTVVSLAVGIPYVLFMWATGLRAPPKMTMEGFKKVFPIGFFHAVGHASAVIALGAGAVSFAQIVKAGEPVFTCLLSYLVLGQTFPPAVYATLIPIIGGVGLASLKELSFTWRALTGAMMSNVAFASRAVYSKAQMDKPVGENLGAANLYGVLTIIAFILSMPFFMYYELPGFNAAWQSAVALKGQWWMLRQLFLDGFYFYAYNEVAFFTLSQVNPITHAIGNTIKRVAIIGVTVLVFRNPVSKQSLVGSVIAILGAMLYSIVKAKTAKAK